MNKHNKDKNKNLLPSIYHTKEVKVTDNKSLTFKETQINVWKKQMIPVAKLQYKTEPNKVINADCVKNARYFIENPMVQMQMKMLHVTVDDVIKMMEDIKREVVMEGSTIECTDYKEV